MKELKFKTSKGSFVVYDDSDNIGKFLSYDLLTKIGYIKSLTEEQASEIVDKIHGNVSFTTTLNIFLKSKGIHLFDNPIDLEEQLDCNCDMCYQKLEEAFDEAEQKTFYNPYLFKL